VVGNLLFQHQVQNR